MSITSKDTHMSLPLVKEESMIKPECISPMTSDAQPQTVFMIPMSQLKDADLSYADKVDATQIFNSCLAFYRSVGITKHHTIPIGKITL